MAECVTHEPSDTLPSEMTQCATQRADLTTTVMNLICSIIGGAVLALPTAFLDMTVIPSLIVITGLGFLSMTSMAMLVNCAELLQCFSYKDMLQRAFGKFVGKVFDVIIFLGAFGLLVVYARVISESMPDACRELFGGRGIFTERAFWGLIGFIVLFPLCCARAMHQLKWSSFVGIATIGFVVVVISLRFLLGTYARSHAHMHTIDKSVVFFDLKYSFFRGIAVVAVAYNCHYTVPILYQELQKRTPAHFAQARDTAMGIVMCTYTVAGLLGYLMFGNKRTFETNGDIVNAFGAQDFPANVARVGLFFHFTSVYPVIYVGGARKCLNSLLFGHDQSLGQNFLVGEAFCIVAVSSALGYFVPGIGVVIQITGALFAITIVFVIPAALYLRIAGGETFWGLFKAPFEKDDSTSTKGDQSSSAAVPTEDSALLIMAGGQNAATTWRRDSTLLFVAYVQFFGGAALSAAALYSTMLRILNLHAAPPP